MRVKDLWKIVPLPEKLRDLWARVTSTRWTKAFCFLAALHCVLQIGLQFGAFGNNQATASSFEAIVSDMVMVTQPFAILENNGDLTLCMDIPQRFGGSDPCTRLSFNGTSSNRVTPITPRFTAKLDDDEFELKGIDEEQPNQQVDVGPECIRTFPWVFEVLHNATREDIFFVLFQVWLFGVSSAAIFCESVPHLATALASESLATVWSVYKVARTKSFKMDFTRIVTNSSCGGINVLPHYFGYREAIEITIMVLNILAFLGFIFLTWRLYKEYAPRMLKRVDSRPDMERLYRVTLSLGTIIHLAAFFLITVAGLFIDQLFIGRIRLVAEHVLVYEVTFVLLIAFVVPWVVTGMWSTWKESRLGMVVFFIISLGFLSVWGAMFASQIYRFMFATWSFFATISVFACLLLVTASCLSVYAFLNFGLGLPEYLQKPLTAYPTDKVSWMIEGGLDLDPAKSREVLPAGAVPNELVPPISNEQNRISILSNGSRYSLYTSPSQPAASQESASDSIQSRLDQPIANNLIISAPANISSSTFSDVPRFPPGLTAPPRKALPAIPRMAHLLAPPSRSRWSSTTASSDPSTPAPISATGAHQTNQSRWSSSTAATTTTSTSGGRLSEVPPVPELPRSRVMSEDITPQSDSTRRNVI